MVKKSILFLFLSFPSILSAQPFPGAIFINGNWIPCNHPIAIEYGYGCVEEVSRTIKIQSGHYYQHKIAGWKLFILSPVQLSSGKVTFLAEVIQGTDLTTGNILFDNGSIIEITSELNAKEWIEVKK